MGSDRNAARAVLGEERRKRDVLKFFSRISINPVFLFSFENITVIILPIFWNSKFLQTDIELFKDVPLSSGCLDITNPLTL